MSRSAERIVSLLWLLLEAGATGRTKNEIFNYLYNPLATTETAKQRQFSRDKEVLTSIGVPIQWQHNAPTGDVYRIDDDQLYLPDLNLTDDEIRALHQARALWMKTPMEDAIHAALTRMTAQQPSDTPSVGAQLGTGQTLLTDIVSAAREQAPVKFHYRTVGRDETSIRHVRPWAVLMAHQQWYFVGWDFQRMGERLFKLSRIESTSIDPLTVDAMSGQQTASLRPTHFNVDAWRQRLHARASASEGYVWLRTNTASKLRVRSDVVEQQQGWELVHVRYDDPHKIAAHIAALTTDARVEVRGTSQLADLVSDILQTVRAAHAGVSTLQVPTLHNVVRTRRRSGNKDVIARRLGIVAVVNQHGGALSRELIRQRFNITDATLTDDLRAMQFWGMPEADFAGSQFEVDPDADPVEIKNAELLAQPWQLSAPEALGLISGLAAVPTIPGISPAQRAAARSLEHKLRQAIEMVSPLVGTRDAVVHPDLSLGPDDDIAASLHEAVRERLVTSISYYSASSDTITTRDIEPHQLLYSSGYGYVQAWCRSTSSRRTFRIDRIGFATHTNEHFTPQPSSQQPGTIAPDVPDDAFTVVLHATHRFRDVIGAYHPTATAVIHDGSIFARLAFRSLFTLLELLTSHPGHIVVVEPPEIRLQIRALTNDALTVASRAAR